MKVFIIISILGLGSPQLFSQTNAFPWLEDFFDLPYPTEDCETMDSSSIDKFGKYWIETFKEPKGSRRIKKQIASRNQSEYAILMVWFPWELKMELYLYFFASNEVIIFNIDSFSWRAKRKRRKSGNWYSYLVKNSSYFNQEMDEEDAIRCETNSHLGSTCIYGIIKDGKVVRNGWFVD